MRELFMMPGPTEVAPSVIQSMCRPAISHGDPRFHDIMDRASEQVAEIIGASGQVVLLNASGRGGIEAAMSTALEPLDRILVINNGVFGNMLREIALRCRLDVVEVRSEQGKPLDLDRIEDAAFSPDLKAIAVVHSETSSGVLNPIREIGEIAGRFNLIYIVDAVSSAGGAEIRMDAWGIDLLCTGSQKCLGSLAGLAPVGIADRMWDIFDRRTTIPQSFFFDLNRWKLMWFKKEHGGLLKFKYRRQPMTVATHLVYALDEASRLVLEEGLETRFRRHRIAAKAIHAALPHLGLTLFPDASLASPTTTAILPPEGIHEGDIRRILRQKYGVLVAGGLEEFYEKMFRIGHMALTASYEYIIPTIAALELTMQELGVKTVETGRAVAAAQEVYAKDKC
ncbi:MAG: alanine--glyoxylate aminotransferase family protein [Candidatus Latescibacter sp.]|nr:alanine--glyoxylate aminotransferase family protein [Candidatus Latescibacter sp.]